MHVISATKIFFYFLWGGGGWGSAGGIAYFKTTSKQCGVLHFGFLQHPTGRGN